VSIADDLAKLEQLRNSGSLTQTEFDEAKHALLHPGTMSPPPIPSAATSATPYPTDVDSSVHRYSDDESLGQAANRYVDFRIVTGVIGGVVALIVFIIILSNMGSSSNDGNNVPGPLGPTIFCTGTPATSSLGQC
jgi:hypothetical protein